MFELTITKILFPWLVSFLAGIFAAPTIIKKLRKYKVWRRDVESKEELYKKYDSDGSAKIAEVVLKEDQDKKTPRMGGLVILFSVALTVVLFWLTSAFVFQTISGPIDFLSRAQTWLPLAAFFAGGLVGFLDDYFTIKNNGMFKNGLPLKIRLVFVTLVSLFAAWWFYDKLGVNEVFIPFYGDFVLGLWFIPFFMFVFMSVFGTSNIDGLDGLAGGIMSIVYVAMGFIALFQDKVDIAALCFVISGGVVAFLWYNIPPAKFYMTEVGYNALSFCLTIVAFLTDSVFLLPIIAFPLFVTLVTTVMQVFSLRVFGKRIFKITPIHHHFEAIGWPGHTIVMRCWIVTLISAVFGVVLAVISIY